GGGRAGKLPDCSLSRQLRAAGDVSRHLASIQARLRREPAMAQEGRPTGAEPRAEPERDRRQVLLRRGGPDGRVALVSPGYPRMESGVEAGRVRSGAREEAARGCGLSERLAHSRPPLRDAWPARAPRLRPTRR